MRLGWNGPVQAYLNRASQKELVLAARLASVLVTIIGAASALALALIRPESPAIESVIRWWSRMWLWASGTDVTVEGGEHIDPKQSYVVVANHLSTLDIMVCFLAVPLPIRYLAKKELFRIPLLAQAMRAVGIIEVDRAASVVVVKRSLSPGFAGIDNPLFYDQKTTMLFGDAKASVSDITAEVHEL